MKLIVFFALAAVALSVPVQQSNVAECKMCEIAIRVDEDVARELTEETFLAECEKEFPESFGIQECKHFVDIQLDGVIRKLEDKAPPAKVCGDIKLC